ncbi:hypothetical protein [Thalassolituus sp.]|uniref:hypothetical protein n=1 Tax=Thalassolituus sp. TaxID=2030822 RepID=UPI002A7ED8D2|nr:hypothetical protein [Thalassolituus sp.]|tara:strand:+ start:6100 stop:6477 length:378 start_codon:yes stop_codon:yes gene_type:complete
MLIENSSDLIKRHQMVRLPSGVPAHEAELISGQALVISSDGLAVYSRAGMVGDPLGNGLVRSVAIPADFCLTLQNDAYIQEHRAGYVGLSDGRVCLITLNDVQLFPSKQQALRNQNEIVRIALGS